MDTSDEAACKCSTRQREIIEKYGHPHMTFCPSYVKQRDDTVPMYREVGMTVWADHCPGCGRWAHVIAGNQSADDIVWCRTICERCGIREVETVWTEGKGWVDHEVPRTG
jgi:hypothetical protein